LIVNAGQPPVIFLPFGKEGQRINITGDLIGIFEKVIFEQIEIEIKNGDRFLLYSDGIVELNGKSPVMRETAIERLIQICNLTRDKPLKKFVNGLPAEMLNSKELINDDIVILGIEV
jgi:sigma-B regulation protein RsbU (phosphoserine phosphatase)